MIKPSLFVNALCLLLSIFSFSANATKVEIDLGNGASFKGSAYDDIPYKGVITFSNGMKLTGAGFSRKNKKAIKGILTLSDGTKFIGRFNRQFDRPRLLEGRRSKIRVELPNGISISGKVGVGGLINQAQVYSYQIDIYSSINGISTPISDDKSIPNYTFKSRQRKEFNGEMIDLIIEPAVPLNQLVIKQSQVTSSSPPYNGYLANGEPHGKSKCIEKNQLKDCKWVLGKLIVPTMAKVLTADEKKSLRCQQILRDIEKHVNLLGNNKFSGCDLKEQLEFVEESWTQDTKGNPMNCLTCQNDTRQTVKDLNVCIRNQKKKISTIEKLNTNYFKSLEENTCLVQIDIVRLKDISTRAIKSKEDSLTDYGNLMKRYKKAEERLQSAREEGLKTWNRQLTANTIQNIKKSISTIGVETIQAVNESAKFSHELMNSYQSENQNVDQSNTKLEKISPKNSTLQKEKAKRKNHDEVLALPKKECLKHSGNEWTETGCKITIPFGGRACYDPTGKNCQTGETLASGLGQKNTKIGKKSGIKDASAMVAESEGGKLAKNNNASQTVENNSAKIASDKCYDLTTQCIQNNHGWEDSKRKKYFLSIKNICNEDIKAQACFAIYDQAADCKANLNIPSGDIWKTISKRKASGVVTYGAANRSCTLPIKKVVGDLREFAGMRPVSPAE